MVPLQNEGRGSRGAGFFDGDCKGGSANGAGQRPVAGVARHGGRGANHKAAGRGCRLCVSRNAKQEKRCAGQRRAALQAAGFIQPEAVRIAAQFQNES
jgi:hypothetical protein